MYERMRTVKAPIIAAMTGHFTAAGMVLAVNADLRIGLRGTRGGITETRVGRGSPWAVPMLWMLPQPVLMEMVLTGEMTHRSAASAGVHQPCGGHAASSAR